jgi:hypothetical protein
MTKEQTPIAPKARPKRTPIASRNILTITGKDPDKVYRIVNDTGDRIEAFKEAGYELVPAKDVRVGDKRVNSSTPEGSYAQVSVGGGQKAFVMAIPKEWYDEDQQAKQANVDNLERSTRQQALSQNELKTGKLDLSRD